MARLCDRAASGDFEGGREIHRRLLPLMEINFVESNPIPVKAALALMGLLEPVWRLPLVAPRAENLARIETILESLHLIERKPLAAASVAN
jgi:4-hydroxy-tetrahydrodipicolinate synthase